MVDMTAIGVITASLNSAVNIAKAMVGIRDATVIQGKVFELQRAILDAQQGIFSANQERAALVDEIGKLKGDLARFENWETEKQRYELQDIGSGAFVYAAKPPMQGGEPVHYLCANCYQDRQKSILQGYSSAYSRTYSCPRCKVEIPAP